MEQTADLAPDELVGVAADTAIEAGTDAETDDLAMPLPEHAETVFLGGLFFLAVLAALYVASEIILPIVLATVLKLILQPVVRFGERLHIPRFIGAMVAVLLVVAALMGVGTLMRGPASEWAGRLPDGLTRLKSEVHVLIPGIDDLRSTLEQIRGTTAGTAPTSSAQPVRAAGLFDTLFSGTKTLVVGFFTMLIVLFYLLMFGETFLRRFVEILPKFKDKRRAVEISLRIEQDVSAYLLTITGINAVVGVATGLLMFVCGVESPVLWGVAAFGLNYIPILGPCCGVVLFCVVGVLSGGVTLWAFLPALLYLLIHIVEGEFVTPMLLARRFTINPVAVVLGLVFWYWMWGIPGAVLAVPMLAITKIICDDVAPLRALGHFLET